MATRTPVVHVAGTARSIEVDSRPLTPLAFRRFSLLGLGLRWRVRVSGRLGRTLSRRLRRGRGANADNSGWAISVRLVPFRLAR